MLDLAPNGAIYQVSPKLFQNGMTRPDYMRHSVVCLMLSHRINQTRDTEYSNSLVPSFFHYRGLVIRSLHEEIDIDYKRTSNLVVAGILILIIIDVSQSYSVGLWITLKLVRHNKGNSLLGDITC